MQRDNNGRFVSKDTLEMRLQSGLKERVNYVFDSAIRNHHTWQKINVDLLAIYSSEAWAKVSENTREYFRGYIDARRHDIDHNHTVWIKSLGGHLVTTREIERLTGYELTLSRSKHIDYRSPWQRVNNDLSRFVWKDADGKPLLDKPLEAKFLES